MKRFFIISVFILTTLIFCFSYADFSEDSNSGKKEGLMSDGQRDFDFLVGEWRVKHKRPKANSNEWLEFDGTCSNRNVMDGSANMDENVLHPPSGAYRAISLRSFDPKTKEWSIWWLDSRYPSGPLDPPVKGRFENGVGKFYSDYMDNGKPMRVRFIWSNITETSARWEQAVSSDKGKTWQTNWIMEFQRT